MNSFLPNIVAFNKASEAGIDIFAPSIFLNGCNFRCPYCMNSKLVDGSIKSNVDLEEVKKFVQEDKSEWLMIGGGEPTCTPELNLKVLIGEVKCWGCKIGLSTNGSNFIAMVNIIEHLNYVALDIKASNDKDYAELSGTAYGYGNVLSTHDLLLSHKDKRGDFDFEVRTTLFPKFIKEQNIIEIGKNIIKKNDKWVLQQFRQSKNMLDSSCCDINPYSEEELQNILKIAKQFCCNVTLRYV